MFFVWALLAVPAYADDSVPQSFKAADGTHKPVLMATTPNASGLPVVAAYKGLDGSWHDTTVIQQICGVGSDGSPTACPTPVSSAMLSNYISRTQLGASDGVAGLDSNQNLTNNLTGSINGLPAVSLTDGSNVVAPLQAPLLTGAPATTAGAQALLNVGRFPIFTDMSSAADVFQSPDSVAIGGLPTNGWNATNGGFNNVQGRPGSLVMTGQPWGPYNAGAIESILWGTSVDQQNGVAALDWRQGAGYIPGSDAVAQYIGVGDAPAFAMGTVDHFDATDVVLKTPLTTAQIATLRIGMYIQTNIIDTTTTNSGMISNGSGGYIARTTAPTDSAGQTTLPTQDWYRGIISGWSSDGTTIRVTCWTNVSRLPETCVVPGAASTDVTDGYWTQWGQPMVFIGAAADGSAHNEYLYYDGSKSTGQGTNLSHSMLSDEIDLRYSATRDNEVSLNGITISVAAMPGTQVGRTALTQDSYMLALSGDIHNVLEMDGPADGNIITGHSFYVHGQEGTEYPSGFTATTTGARPVQTNFYHASYADSQDVMYLIGYQQAYGTGTGASNTSYHLGMHVNGNAMQPTSTGINYGEIEWNPGGIYGSVIGLCAANELCGVEVNGTGAAYLPHGAYVTQGGLSAGNGLTIGAQPGGYAAALGVYAAAGYGNNLIDVEAGNASKFLVDASGNGTLAGSLTAGGNLTTGASANLVLLPPAGVSGYPLLSAPDGATIKAGTSVGGAASLSAYNVTASGIFQGTLSTPSSSSAACTPGQFTDDTDYHYVCVAANTWKRVALSTW